MTQSEVLRVAEPLKEGKSPRPAGISQRQQKYLNNWVPRQMAEFMAMQMQIGIFSQIWKKEKEDPETYRPICLLGKTI